MFDNLSARQRGKRSGKKRIGQVSSLMRLRNVGFGVAGEIGAGSIYILWAVATRRLPLALRHFVETPAFPQNSNKFLNGLAAGVQRERSAVTFSERHRTMRTFTYRVYFTISPTTYYVVGARNANAAVWRARRTQRALRVIKRRTAPLKLAKIERLYRHGAMVRRVH